MAIFSLLSPAGHVTTGSFSLLFLHFCNGKAIESTRRKHLTRFCGRKQIRRAFYQLSLGVCCHLTLCVFAPECSGVCLAHPGRSRIFFQLKWKTLIPVPKKDMVNAHFNGPRFCFHHFSQIKPVILQVNWQIVSAHPQGSTSWSPDISRNLRQNIFS